MGNGYLKLKRSRGALLRYELSLGETRYVATGEGFESKGTLSILGEGLKEVRKAMEMPVRPLKLAHLSSSLYQKKREFSPASNNLVSTSPWRVD